MFFSPRLPIPVLLAWCRAMRHGMNAGLSPVRVFRHQAKSGPPAGRALADQLADRLGKGESLQDAIRPDNARFPMLFVELIAVGEQTGRLSETFEALEDYFETVQASRRDLVRALVWPAITYVGAVLTITLMLLVLGLLAPTGGKAFDPLGLGLTGPGGAATFLFGAATFTAVVIFLFVKIRDDDSARAAVEGAALPVPGLGGCFRAFALQRFSLALFMTSEAGLRADRAVKLSLRATANRAYMQNAERARKLTREGHEVADVLAGCGPHLFPPDYLEAVEVGEVSGQLAEVMAKLAKQYQEEAARKLKLLTMLLSGGVYGMIVLFVVFLIFKLALFYIGMINNFADGKF